MKHRSLHEWDFIPDIFSVEAVSFRYPVYNFGNRVYNIDPVWQHQSQTNWPRSYRLVLVQSLLRGPVWMNGSSWYTFTSHCQKMNNWTTEYHAKVGREYLTWLFTWSWFGEIKTVTGTERWNWTGRFELWSWGAIKSTGMGTKMLHFICCI